FRVDITPYFMSLIDPDDPADPVRRQVIPLGRELRAFTGMMEDSLAEDRHSPVPGLVHRYPDRVLMLVTTQCASYCRYCTRSRIVGDPSAQFSRSDYDAQIDYLARTPQVRDVLLSGGDPLVLAPKLLENLIGRLRAIPHIEIIRIGSRVPVFMPQRVDQELCDLVEGAGHVRTTVNKGVEIMEGLRGHTSGYAVPQYMIDAPGGGGKIPVQPNYVISSAPGKVVLRNFEGFLTTYSEPMDYDPNEIKHLEAQAVHRPEPGQSGVLGLLEGERLAIEPEGFESTHVRGAGHQHRLNTDTH